MPDLLWLALADADRDVRMLASFEAEADADPEREVSTLAPLDFDRLCEIDREREADLLGLALRRLETDLNNDALALCEADATWLACLLSDLLPDFTSDADALWDSEARRDLLPLADLEILAERL